MENRSISNFVLRPLYLSPNFTAKELNDHILKWNNSVHHPTWQVLRILDTGPECELGYCEQRDLF